MWYSIFKFEIEYRLKRLDTYAFFTFIFLFSIVAIDFIYSDRELGLVKKNAPIIIAKTMGAFTGISMMIVSLIMGVPIIRDFEYNMESLIFVNPIKKRDYLLGRFLGSFVILLFVFSTMVLGNAIGEFMPWRNPEEQNPFRFIVYLQPFFTVVLPILFSGASLFFVSGFLSRKLIVVYTQGLFIFVFFILTRSIENEFVAAILGPFTLNSLSTMTDSWSTSQLNSQLIPLSGVLLYNKLFWIAIGVLILAIGYKRFNFNVVKSSTSKKKSKAFGVSEIQPTHNEPLPNFRIGTGLKAQCVQLLQHSLFYFKSILKETSFWAIIICAMVIIVINSISLGTVYGVDSYPATYFIVEELLEMSSYFFLIVLVFYSGELIWKERSAKLNLIYDALPSSDFINLAGKFIGLNLIYAVLMCSIIIAGILFQTFNGYYSFDLTHYFVSFFGDFLPVLSLFTFISFFIHSILNQKFVAYVLVLFFIIALIALPLLGYKHSLYSFGGPNVGTYSQMNGYGHFVKPFLWFKAYWFTFCLILLLISSIFMARGTETSFLQRWKQSKYRFTKSVAKPMTALVVLFVLTGSFIYYNTNILNTYWTDSEKVQFRAEYEKSLKPFEYLPQPKITDVNLRVELYPKQRNYTVEGYYMLTNVHDQAIETIHIQKLIEDCVTIESVEFEAGFSRDSTYEKYGYYIYTLNKPLQSGESVKMNFRQSYRTVGFENNGESSTKIVHNGTFFDNNDFPTLGYNNKYELRDKEKREAIGLLPRKGMADKSNLLELKNGVNGDDGYNIKFEMIIGTDSNQTAIAPGTLVEEWNEGSRNYYHYKMNRALINFYAIVSAEYEVEKSIWNPVNDSISKPVDLEIYYHKEHDYNLNRMMKSMKVSLDYFSKNFGTYPYEQLRIMEFPRYAEFAQSFPTTIPFSEGLGFMLDIDDETDVDMVFYITAHELAHQWWGLQVVAANVKGRNMILETLAQYSAIMVLKQYYSEEKVQQFLDGERDSYLEGKAKDKVKEPSLALVEKQEYIYYSKGAINMYGLQQEIGEENVNLALKQFVADWNAFNPNFDKNRYATTDDLLEYFRGVTSANLQYVITNLFESDTLYRIERKRK
jgi:ABC-2 type transport system permease protein